VDFVVAKLKRLSQLDIATCCAVVQGERRSFCSVILKIQPVCVYKIHLKIKNSNAGLQKCILIFPSSPVSPQNRKKLDLKYMN
jgi:hypothetical protein